MDAWMRICILLSWDVHLFFLIRWTLEAWIKTGEAWCLLVRRKAKKGQWRHEKHENVKVAESVECFISHAKDAKVDRLNTTVVRTQRCTTEGSLDENVVSGTATPMNSDCESHLLLSNIQRICWLSPQWLQKEFFIILLYWSSPPPFCTFFFLPDAS